MHVAVLTASPCEVSQNSSTQMSDKPVYSLSLDVAVHTIFHSVCSSSLDAAVQTIPHSTFSQKAQLPLISVDTSMQIPIRSVVQHDAATQPELTEFFIGCIYSNNPLDRQNFVRQSPPSVLGSHALPPTPPGLEQPAPPPELAAYSHLLANVSSSSCHTKESLVCTTHVGTHLLRTASCTKRSASTAFARTHNSTGSTFRTGTGLFTKPKAVTLPMVNFGHPQSNGPGPIATADNDFMHHQFRIFFTLSVESRPGVQKSYQHCFRCLW